MWKTKEKLEKKGGDKKKITIFEKVMNDLKNMENCIEHYIQVAKKHENQKFSAIERNNSKHLEKDPRLSNYRSIHKNMARATSYNIAP